MERLCDHPAMHGPECEARSYSYLKIYDLVSNFGHDEVDGVSSETGQRGRGSA